jgi:hypothetical protein
MGIWHAFGVGTGKSLLFATGLKPRFGFVLEVLVAEMLF